MAFSSSQRKKSRIERFGRGGVQAKALLVRVTSAQSSREVYLSKSDLLILTRVDGIDKCHALSPALTNGWSRIAHKQALERCLGLIVFKENQRGVRVGSLGRLVSKDVHRWLLGQV